MTAFVGIDLGSSAIKTVVVDGEGEIRHRWLRPTTLQLQRDLCELAEQLEGACGRDRLVVATGYGRQRITEAAATKPEIACHARGVWAEFAVPATIIDIGGQDNKVIHLEANGTIARFRMNTKCAAGTGAFLEEIAGKARLTLGELHERALSSLQDSPINSFCTVFAMTELIRRVMAGEELADLARGVYLSIAERLREMYASGNEQVIVTGGVIHHNPILRSILAERLGDRLLVPAHPQFTGALGAALYAVALRDVAVAER